MSIELAFSFAVGVSCLVFSLNLVRKLREDGSDNGGGGSGDYYRHSLVRGGNNGLGGLGVQRGAVEGGAEVGKFEENTRRGGVGKSGVDRGIGSLLKRDASSQRELYDSADELEEAEATAVEGGGGSQGGVGGRGGRRSGGG